MRVSRVYKATFKCVASTGALIQPGVHYKVDVPAGGSEPPPDDVASAIWTHIGVPFAACTPLSTHIDDLVVTEMVLPGEVGVQGVHHVGAVGDFSVDAGDLPEGLVPIINLRSGSIGRSTRGHLCMPCPRGSGTLNLMKWSGGIVTALNAFGALLNDTIGMGGLFPPDLVPVIYSRTRAVRAQDPTTFNVSAATLNLTPHWLRSRMTTP